MKNSTKYAAILVVIIVLVIGISLFAIGRASKSPNKISATGTGVSGAANSKTVFTYSDAGASGVSSVNIQVQSVQMQNSATGQWYTTTMVSNGGNLKLEGESSYTLIGNASVPTGTYDAVELNVQSATATYANGTTKTIIMPNSTIRMTGGFTVQSTSNTSSTNWVNLDIDSNESLHSTTSGQLAFFPVVKLVAWSNAQLTSGANNTVSVQNYGTVTADQRAGMNINGQMQVNFTLPQTANITVSGTGLIIIKGEAVSGSGQTSVHQILITDPAQFPKGTQAAVITYSQIQVQTMEKGTSGTGWITAQGNGSVNLTAIQNSAQIVGYLNLSSNASIKAVKYTIGSAYIVINNTRYAMEVPDNQITANVTWNSSTSSKANSTIVVEISPTAIATYNQNATTYLMSAYSSAIVTSSNTTTNANIGANVQLGVNVDSELSSSIPSIQITSATLVKSGNDTMLSVTVKNDANNTIELNNVVLYGKQNVSSNSGVNLNLSVDMGYGTKASLSGAALAALNIESGNMVAFSTYSNSLTQISSGANAVGSTYLNSGASSKLTYNSELGYDSGILHSTIYSGSEYQIIVTGSNGASATINVTATSG